MRSAIALTALGALLSYHAVAYAGSDDDAKDLFARGRELRLKGDCAAAVPLFQKAFRLLPSGLGSLRNAAECEEGLGRWASSHRDWLELHRALLVNKDKKYDTWLDDAKAAVARLAPKVPHLKVEIATADKTLDPKELGALKVTLDSEPLDPTLVGTTLDRDPGKHKVRVEGGVAPVEREVELVASDDKTVRVVIELEKPKPPEPPSEPPKPKEPPGTKGVPPKEEPKPNPDTKPGIDEDVGKTRTMRTFGFVAIGVGGASAIAAVVSLVVRSSALDEVDGSCPSHVHCAPSVQAAVDRGQTASALVNVFAVGTLLFTGIGVGLVLAHPAPGSHAGLHLTPFASPHGGGVAFVGAF